MPFPTLSAPPDAWKSYRDCKVSRASFYVEPPPFDEGDSEIEDDATMDRELEIGKLKHEGSEDDDMGASDAMSNASSSSVIVEVEESDHEEPEEVSLKADSPWTNTNPEREEILRLRRLWAPKDLPPRRALPGPTARDVAFTAFSSVQFLRDLQGTSINKSEIGIDHAGRLFDLQTGGKNFHKDFDDMVMEIRRDSQSQPSRKRIEKTLKEHIDAEEEMPWMEGVCHGEDAYSSLLVCARAVVEAQRFEIRDLQRVRTKCAKLMEEMQKVISIANAVVLDLKDTGSTTSNRWNALVRMEDKPLDVESVVAGNQIPRRGLRKTIRVLESFTRPYQKFLGRTLHLDDCLKVAIEELGLPVDGFED